MQKFLLLFDGDIFPWNCFEELWKMKSGHLFPPFLPIILQKFCNFSVLKQVFSICTNFHNDWLKTWPGIRYLVFLLGNLPQFWKFVKETSQIKCKNWHNFRSRFDYDLRVFLNVVFWKVFHLWCAVPLQDFSGDVNDFKLFILFFLQKDFAHTKSTKNTECTKAQNATSEQK